ncbi:MAG: response regulator [Polyangiaceae bacterium]
MSGSLSARPVMSGDAGDILIVDDFVDTLALYEALLTDDGHRVRTATGGIEALRRVEEREPEVVLLDVSMPGMDGIEVLKWLRARPNGGPSVIMLTAARREPSAIESGLREGADAYLAKPIDGRELVARSRGALESFRLKRQLEAQRRDHIAMLVHDLRHPLASLVLIAELLDAGAVSEEERREAVDTIRRLSTDMGRLVDDVLMASRLEAGVFSVAPETITVGELADASLRAFGIAASRRKIDFIIEADRTVKLRVDPLKLRQAIDNLLANAFKFTPRGGKVRFSAVVGKDDARIEVEDSGPGIPEAERATIFDRYKQGARGRSSGGAGLGLAIARGIAEAHSGSISIYDGSLGGVGFRITVPI